MDWINIDSNERIRCWKKMRKTLAGLSLDEQTKIVAEFFKLMPVGARLIDYYTPSSWPGPWEILHSNVWCMSSISVLMYYTFRLVSTVDLELLLINDVHGCFLVLNVDNQYILNYEIGQISNLQDIKNNVIEIYTSDKIKSIS